MKMLVVAALIALANCAGPSTKQIIAQCTLDADHIYASTDPHRYDMVSSYVMTCMQAKGFDLSYEGPECSANVDRSMDARCYQRSR